MFNSPKLSLEDILGKEYVAKVVEANDALGTMDSAEGAKIGAEKIDFYPEAKQKKNSAFPRSQQTSSLPLKTTLTARQQQLFSMH